MEVCVEVCACVCACACVYVRARECVCILFVGELFSVFCAVKPQRSLVCDHGRIHHSEIETDGGQDLEARKHDLDSHTKASLISAVVGGRIVVGGIPLSLLFDVPACLK